MYKSSDIIERKFIDSINLENLEIETDSGWQPISTIQKTIPYTVWNLVTENGLTLTGADTHILFDENLNEIFIKDLIVNKSKIMTKYGIDTVVSVTETAIEENMFDLTVLSDDHRFYSNNILSHNTTLAQAISYGLYGQPLTNIKLDNLVNKINQRNMTITINFEVNGHKYRIERGRKPN